MLFVIDIGNSHTVIGLYDNDDLQGHWRITSNRRQTPDEIAIQFRSLVSMAQLSDLTITDIIISSVVPSLEAAWVDCCNKHFAKHLNHPPFIVNDENIKDIISVETDYPSEVGADRLVNGIAAWDRFRTDTIVIDFGTAITFDCITAQCQYIGGVILPGVAVSLEALSMRAAKLPHINISTPPRTIIGKNTVDAMKSGTLHGYGAMIDGMVKILGDEMTGSHKNVNVIATGGMANIVIPYCRRVDHIDQMLTLRGLYSIYSKIYA